MSAADERKIHRSRALRGQVMQVPSAITIACNPPLVYYFPFDGDATDQSGNGHNGTVNGATLVADRNGTANSAYAFDGSSWIEAAGNYVEIHVAGAVHLARGTLAAFEARLAGRGFVRIHRSRLLNRARMTAFKPTASGDLEITLDDGQVIAGSRRFRSSVDA